MHKNVEKGAVKRVEKGKAEELILSAMSQGKNSRSEILGYIKEERKMSMHPRTFSKAIKALIDKKMVRRLRRGWYIPSWHITLEEAVKSIEHTLKQFALTCETVSLEDLSIKSQVPTTWKQKLGESEVTFSDLAYGLSRRFDVKIGGQTTTRPAILGS